MSAFGVKRGELEGRGAFCVAVLFVIVIIASVD
jgi:hypothetical protein